MLISFKNKSDTQIFFLLVEINQKSGFVFVFVSKFEFCRKLVFYSFPVENSAKPKFKQNYSFSKNLLSSFRKFKNYWIIWAVSEQMRYTLFIYWFHCFYISHDGRKTWGQKYILINLYPAKLSLFQKSPFFPFRNYYFTYLSELNLLKWVTFMVVL